LINLLKDNSYKSLEIILDKNVNYDSNSLFLSIQNYSNFKITYLDAPLYKLKHHINVSSYVNKSKSDIYFYPHFDLPIFIKNKKSKFVVHDLLPLVVDDYILRFKTFKKFFFKTVIKINLRKNHTDCIAVSKSTKRDILKYINPKISNKIKVIYEDAFDVVINTTKVNTKIKEILYSKFLFYIGDRRPHKNLLKMIEIFNYLKENNKYDGYFIIAGSEKNFNFNVNEKVKNNKYIKLIGKVSDKELSSLYSKMDSLFFISKYEGFGLPIIEAAMNQKKIITSNTSSCGEIAPSSALLLDPNLPSKLLAEKCINYLEKDELIDNFNYLKKFSWQKTVTSIFVK
jgi:hypothetical protein